MSHSATGPGAEWLFADAQPAGLPLNADELHVWRVPLDISRDRIDQLGTTLNPAELERAGRFHFERDRNHFVTARGQLRAVLGRYLNLSPRRVSFRYGAKGKPHLLADPPPLQFNLAHSGELALIAVTLGQEVGVDVEFHRPGVTEDQIAERFFSVQEVATLRSLPKPEQEAAFYRCWTRKEAYLKANGKGLSFGLYQFSVSLAPGEPASLLATPFDPAEAGRWSFFHLEPGSGYTGAVAMRGQVSKVRRWQASQW